MRRFQILVCDGPSCGITHESERFVALLRARIAADPELRPRVHVAVAPGNGFGEHGEGYVRVGLLTEESRLAEAAERIVRLGLFSPSVNT